MKILANLNKIILIAVLTLPCNAMALSLFGPNNYDDCILQNVKPEAPQSTHFAG